MNRNAQPAWHAVSTLRRLVYHRSRRRPAMRAGAVLGLGLLAVMLIGCGSAADVLDRTPTPAPRAETTPTPVSASGTGEEQVSGGVAIVLTNLQFLETASYVSAREGMSFLSIDVTLRNDNPMEVTVGSRAIKLIDAAGNEYRRNLAAATAPSPQSTIPPAGETSGNFTFEVPKDTARFELLITVGDDEPAVFEITRP